MPNYADRASVFEGCQVGSEAAFGQQVAAIRRLLGIYIDPTPNVPITPHRGRGSLGATSFVQGKEHTIGNLSGIAGFRDILWPLAGVLCDINPTTPSGATLTRRWVWKPLNYQPNSIRTFSFEHGSNNGTFAERFVYGLVNTLAIRSTETEVAVSGSVLGRQLQEAISVSTSRGAAATPTIAPVISATGSSATAAAPTLSQSANGQVTASTTGTVVLGADPAVGDCLVLAVINDVQGTTVTPSGGGVTWVQAQTGNATGQKTTLFYGLNASGVAGGKTVTVTLSVSGNAAMRLLDFVGVATASAVDGAIPAANTGTTGNATSPSETPAQPGDLIVSAAGTFFGGGNTIVPATSSGWVAGTTSSVSNGTLSYAVNTAHNLTTAAGSVGQETWTTVSTAAWVGLSLALKTASPTVGGTTSLLPGNYVVAYTYVDQSGETLIGPVSNTLALLYGQSISAAALTGLPSGANVKWYMSPAAGTISSGSLLYTGQQNIAASPTVFTVLPTGAAVPGGSTTTSLTVASVPDTPIPPKSISVFAGLGPWLTGPGTPTGGWVQLGRCFESEWSVSDRYGLVVTQDDTQPSFTSFVEITPNVMATTHIEHDAQSQGFMANLRASQDMFIRWVATGSLIEAGFPFRLEVIMPTRLINPRPADIQNTYGRQYDWHARNDDVFGGLIQVTLDTDQAAL